MRYSSDLNTDRLLYLSASIQKTRNHSIQRNPLDFVKKPVKMKRILLPWPRRYGLNQKRKFVQFYNDHICTNAFDACNFAHRILFERLINNLHRFLIAVGELHCFPIQQLQKVVVTCNLLRPFQPINDTKVLTSSFQTQINTLKVP